MPRPFLIHGVAALTLFGCSEPPTPVHGPSGAVIGTAKCSQSSASCLEQASRACGGGTYQVLGSESHAGGLLADVIPGPVTWFTMAYQCGPTDGRPPDFPFGGPTMADVMAEMPPPAPSPHIDSPIRTSCNSMGGYTNCTTY